jgi:hypothetical protein
MYLRRLRHLFQIIKEKEKEKEKEKRKNTFIFLMI